MTVAAKSCSRRRPSTGVMAEVVSGSPSWRDPCASAGTDERSRHDASPIAASRGALASFPPQHAHKVTGAECRFGSRTSPVQTNSSTRYEADRNETDSGYGEDRRRVRPRARSRPTSGSHLHRRPIVGAIDGAFSVPQSLNRWPRFGCWSGSRATYQDSAVREMTAHASRLRRHNPRHDRCSTSGERECLCRLGQGARPRRLDLVTPDGTGVGPRGDVS